MAACTCGQEGDNYQCTGRERLESSLGDLRAQEGLVGGVAAAARRQSGNTRCGTTRAALQYGVFAGWHYILHSPPLPLFLPLRYLTGTSGGSSLSPRLDERMTQI